MAMFKHHKWYRHIKTRRNMIRGMGFMNGPWLTSFPMAQWQKSGIKAMDQRELWIKAMENNPLEMHGSWDAHGYCMNRGCGLPVLPGLQGMQQGLTCWAAVVQTKQRWWHRNSFLALRHWIPNLLQTRFVTKVIIMIIMQAKHADVFMFSLEKMWRRRGGPIYGPIIGQRWSTILGAALVIFGTLAGMRPNRK
jgi:hypothetical protein